MGVKTGLMEQRQMRLLIRWNFGILPLTLLLQDVQSDNSMFVCLYL